MSRLAKGTTISNFKIEKLLGSGGFSNVYLASDNNSKNIYAIKEFFPEEFARRNGNHIYSHQERFEEFEWAKKKFISEATILGKLDSDNIINIIQIIEAFGSAYIVMEYINGVTMKTWLKQIGGIANQAEIDLIFKPLIQALNLCHRNGILHRDISPDNILLRNTLDPVLIDFGASKEINIKNLKTKAIIKDGLSPPEQYSTDHNLQGPWSDIYSLGACMYFSICSIFPQNSMERLLDDKHKPLVASQYPLYRTDLINTINRSLALDPRRRPQTLEEFLI